jgi:hypothetical protein
MDVRERGNANEKTGNKLKALNESKIFILTCPLPLVPCLISRR